MNSRCVWQEVVAVGVVITAGCGRAGLAQLQQHVADTLHPSKWPQAIVYMDRYGHTPNLSEPSHQQYGHVDILHKKYVEPERFLNAEAQILQCSSACDG